MSLAGKAAKLAQQEGREQREKNAAARTAYIKKLEDMLTERTGLTAVHVDQVEVAHVDTKYPSGNYGPRGEVVEYEKWERLQIDDVFVLARKDHSSSSSYDFYFDSEDPERGHYRPEYGGSIYFTMYERLTEEERTEKFIAELARHRKGEHPEVVLAKKGESCPTCGRGY